ncbi:phosphotransferase enzyme family protein [Ktedonosporobacter rubrisoli]|nr:phosphotransferase [Ktedonosporobacter rubrisoli]
MRADELMTIVTQAYPVEPISTCEVLRLHPHQNSTYVLRTTNGASYLLRLYGRHWRSHPRICYEISLLNHLAEKGVAVSTPLQRTDGQFFAPLLPGKDERYFALFTSAPGELCTGGSLREYHAGSHFGRAVAHVHTASDDFTCRWEPLLHDLDYLLYEPLAHLSPWFQHRPHDLEYLYALTERIEKALTPLMEAGLNWGVCHGDLPSGNAHITSKGLVTFFDFDGCGMGWRAAELSQILEGAAWRNEPAIWSHFLEGYQEVRPLHASDMQAIPWFVATGPIWFLGTWAQEATLGFSDALPDEQVDTMLGFLHQWEERHFNE